MKPRVRITIDFEVPGGQPTNPRTLEECCKLVLHQMRAVPEWEDPAGTGHLNYVCHDHSMRIVAAEIRD